MIFKDYYRILCIAFHSSASEIKAAYREQSKRWHPDINPDANSVKVMQDINEAYAILKDETKKTRYDKEYLLYLKSQNIKKPSVTNSKNEYQNKENFDYSVQDEQVKQDIHDAHEYAVKLVNEFLQTLKRTSKDAAKGAWDEMKFYLLGALIVSLIGW